MKAASLLASPAKEDKTKRDSSADKKKKQNNKKQNEKKKEDKEKGSGAIALALPTSYFPKERPCQVRIS
jgi:hypothetical protein